MGREPVDLGEWVLELLDDERELVAGKRGVAEPAGGRREPVPDSGHEKLPADGHETARWRT